MVIAATATLGALSALAETVTGPVRPMDGDTFEMAGVGVVRLADIDAPEIAQRCEGGPKELRDCGVFVTDVLAGRIRGQSVECEVHALDEYKRRIASCSHAGEDLSTWLVSEGLALAFRRYSKAGARGRGRKGSRPRVVADQVRDPLRLPGASLGGGRTGRARRMRDKG